MRILPRVVPTRRARRAIPMFVAGLLLLAGLPALSLGHGVPWASPIGFAHPAANTTTVLVNLTDGAFVPSSISIPSNSTVDLHLVNTGNYTHTFTLVNLSESGVRLDRAWTPVQLDQYFVQHPPQANVTLAVNQSGWANLTYAASNLTRSFEFVSVTPYQFQAGLYGFLNVSSIGPAQLLYANTTNSLAFDPSVLAATPSGGGGATTIHLQITNVGSFPHTFTLAGQTNVTIGTTGYFSSNAPLINVSIPQRAGSVVWANFTIPARGVYEFVCAISGHFEAGMYGFLYVGVPPPAPLAPPSTAIVEVGVLVAAAGLLGFGALLVIVAGLVGRFPKPPRSQDGQGPH